MKLTKNKLKEIIREEIQKLNEGKKKFRVNPHAIGKAKYSIDFHDGKSKHKDGSDFWGINIFKNKKDLAKAIKDYEKKGYIKESKLTESKLRNTIRQQLNEATLNDSEQLLKDVVGIMKKHFPGSYHNAKWGVRLYESIQGTFILGTKSQWANGIAHNSPCHFNFVIDGMEDGNIGESKIVFQANGGLSFLIKPIKQTWLVYEQIKVPARKKTANSKAILKHIDGIFSNLKKSLKKNFDKMTPEHQKEYKKFI